MTWRLLISNSPPGGHSGQVLKAVVVYCSIEANRLPYAGTGMEYQGEDCSHERCIILWYNQMCYPDNLAPNLNGYGSSCWDGLCRWPCSIYHLPVPELCCGFLYICPCMCLGPPLHWMECLRHSPVTSTGSSPPSNWKWTWIVHFALVSQWGLHVAGLGVLLLWYGDVLKGLLSHQSMWCYRGRFWHRQLFVNVPTLGHARLVVRILYLALGPTPRREGVQGINEGSKSGTCGHGSRQGSIPSG